MTKNIIILIVVVVLVLVLAYFMKGEDKPSIYDNFAQCLAEKGAVFYGAFWCPHCKEQKEMFGKSVKYLPYVECSTPDGRSQNQACKDKGIQSYPTWDFVLGSTTERVSGTLELKELALKTNCILPE